MVLATFWSSAPALGLSSERQWPLVSHSSLKQQSQKHAKYIKYINWLFATRKIHFELFFPTAQVESTENMHFHVV